MSPRKRLHTHTEGPSTVTLITVQNEILYTKAPTHSHWVRVDSLGASMVTTTRAVWPKVQKQDGGVSTRLDIFWHSDLPLISTFQREVHWNKATLILLFVLMAHFLCAKLVRHLERERKRKPFTIRTGVLILVLSLVPGAPTSVCPRWQMPVGGVEDNPGSTERTQLQKSKYYCNTKLAP